VVESVNHAAVKRIIGTADPAFDLRGASEARNVERHGIVIAQCGSFLVSDSHSNLGV
jgi:hypothetical protein